MCFIYITLLTLIDHSYSIESVNCLILFHGNCRPRAFCCAAVLLYGSTIYTLVVMGYQDFQFCINEFAVFSCSENVKKVNEFCFNFSSHNTYNLPTYLRFL